jgi:hypothetical protein
LALLCLGSAIICALFLNIPNVVVARAEQPEGVHAD